MTNPQDPFARPEGTPSYGPPPQPAQPWGAPPPPGWGPPPQAWSGPQQTDTRAIVALVLAIGSFVVLPVIPAIVALVLAGSSRRDIAASGGRLGGESLVTAARVIAWINLGLAAVAVVLLVLAFVLFASVGFSA